VLSVASFGAQGAAAVEALAITGLLACRRKSVVDELMKLHGLTPVVSLISSAESAEALTLLRSSSYGGSVRRIHPRAYARGLLRRRINSGSWFRRLPDVAGGFAPF